MNEYAASTSKLPRSAEIVKQLLDEVGIKNYESQIVMQMCDLAHSLTKYILIEAQALSKFAGKAQVDKSDIEFVLRTSRE